MWRLNNPETKKEQFLPRKEEERGAAGARARESYERALYDPREIDASSALP